MREAGTPAVGLVPVTAGAAGSEVSVVAMVVVREVLADWVAVMVELVARVGPPAAPARTVARAAA